MSKKSKKLSWEDTKDLAFRLIDEHPATDPSRLSLGALTDMVRALPDFSDKKSKPDSSTLEDLQTRWVEERSEMEDELGPFEAFEEDSELDEDIYRADRMVEDEDEEEEESDDRFESYDDEFEEDEEEF